MLSFELHLRNPTDFFMFHGSDYDPFDPQALDVSGIDYLMSRLRGRGLRTPRVRATLYLPSSAITPDLETRMQEALRRYCGTRLQELSGESREFFMDNAAFGLIAVVIVLIGLSLQSRIPYSPLPGSEVTNALSLAIDVLVWVALWTPLSAYMQDWVPRYRQRGRYRALMEMELSVRPEEHPTTFGELSHPISG